MKLRVDEKSEAISLRQKGFTYNEIRATIPNLSKGTLSSWLRHVELDEKQKQRILEKVKTASHVGQIKGAWANHIKAQKRIDQISLLARVEFTTLVRDPRFLTGVALYWAEGAKISRCFQFINSDPKMIRVMMSWLQDVCKISPDQIGIRVYAHKIYADENPEKFWAGIVGIPASKFKKTVYKPTPWTTKKNPSYIGCCRIEVRGSELYWKTIAWISEIEKLYMPL